MRLQRLRQGSLLAISLTAMILLATGSGAAESSTEPTLAAPASEDITEVVSAGEGLDQATTTMGELLTSMYALLPKLAVAVVLLLAAWLVSAGLQWILRRTLHSWNRVDAVAALVRIVLYLGAIAAGLAIIAGDARALLGSVGLVGLALSWALQTPIESFTGWLLNSFRGYYQVGDRIEVGEVFGDVYKIDVLTTTVWEAGGPGKPVAGAQPTGAMITFPNWEVLRSNIVNYSRVFPFVWDEVEMAVTNESDLPYAVEVISAAARTVLGPQMAVAAEQYQELLARARIAFDVEELPTVYVSHGASWTNCTVRYLVPARQRRRWSSELVLTLSRELARPEHAGRIISAYPRQELRMVERWTPNPAPAGG